MSKCNLIIKKYRYRIFALFFWILVWELLSLSIGNAIFLPSPYGVLKCTIYMIQTEPFWVTIAHSFGRIAIGFFLAAAIGVFLSSITYHFRLIREVVLLLMQTIKSIPVASFVILALLWVKAVNLSILISFLMVLPIMYMNVTKGIQETDSKLLEMAKVFRVSATKKVRYIYLPSVMPYFVSACSIGQGFCWKSGIAAEVISLASNSIGERLYEAKLYLNTEELFGWTIVIVILSTLFEKLIMIGIRMINVKIIERG